MSRYSRFCFLVRLSPATLAGVCPSRAECGRTKLKKKINIEIRLFAVCRLEKPCLVLYPSYWQRIQKSRSDKAISLDADNSTEEGGESGICRRHCKLQNRFQVEQAEKRLKNDLENMLIFENTHDAIFDRKTFNLVQKHFAGRKCLEKQGEVDKYAGYHFCGECGKRLYLLRVENHQAGKQRIPIRRLPKTDNGLYRTLYLRKCA